MPSGFNQATSDVETVVGVQFSIMSPDEIEKRSVVEVVTQATFEGNEPKIGGLFDPRMGVLENGKICRSCGQTNHSCPGHFGHFRLTRPVYFWQFHEKIINVLKCVCIRCGKLKLDKGLRASISLKKEENRWREVLKACQTIGRCGWETEDGCGALQPVKYERKGIANIVAHFPAENSGKEMVDIFANLMEGAPQKKPVFEAFREQLLEVEYVHRLFRRITDEDVDYMGFSRFWCRPDWMICTVLPIPPPQMRPSVVQDNNTRSEDDLTHKLFEIIKSDRNLQEKIDRNSPKSIIDEHTNIVQYHVATLVDNQIPGVAPSAQRSGRPLKSIQQRIGSKEGRIRYNIQGKRVEFSARSVITPDPNLSIDELGVPLEIATNLTFPERVTQYNKDKMYKLVQNGADIYPGAKTVVKADGRMISLKHVNTKEIVLYNGDVVNRHLLDGDIVLFNRQPTLHKMSMMAHRVKVLPGKTFRLNVLVTRPYNADFDGDEMNMHAPQSYEAATELEEIAAIPYNIVSPRHAKPLIGVFQDSVVGSYRLTRASVEFTRREFMNLMMRNKRFEGVMPPPKAANGTRWSGKQALSQLFPPINIQVGNKTFDKDTDSPDNNESFIKIKQGELIQGQIDGPTWMSSGKGIIHTLYNDYGPQETSMLLDSLQRVVEDYLVLDGFSVGISDLVADETTAKSIQTVIADCKKKIEEIQFQVHTDIFENNTGKTNQQEFEDQAFGFLRQATTTASNAVKKSLSSENRLVAMINSGSKGDWVNIAQMIACLGQQAIENKRIVYGFTDRTLPHYKKYDDGAEARGFIESSFIRGLTPQEFFFHAMSGREGLIDTAVKSVTGDTPIVIMEKGRPKYVRIGDWIDAQLDAPGSSVEYHEDRNLELLHLEAPVHIPTSDLKGTVTWGHVTAITRHDPGTQLYEIKTEGGKEVIVTESKSLLVWNEEEQQFQRLNTPEVKTGQYVPVTMRLAAPPILLKSIDVSHYLPKNTYIYGSEFLKAKAAIEEAMKFGDGLHIPQGWWGINNGTTFTLPYDSKARFTRALHRSNMECIQEGCVYPYAANRTGAKIPDQFELNHDNGLFLGLFLAEGNVDVKSGYVQITNNNSTIREFVKGWFTKQSIKFSEEIKSNHIGGTSSGVRGFSTILALFLDALVGHGAGQKHIPDEAIAAPEAFLQGLLNGYFSGDGTVSHNSVEVGSASKRLMEGISMLCTRLSLFGKTFQTQLHSNNLGTEHIQPTYRFSLRGQWASQFAKRVALIDSAKQDRLTKLQASASHRNFTEQNDVVLDKIVEINILGVEKYPKMYDLTVPSTLNFGLANGLHVVDTAETGYIQRQIIKALEDLVVQHDGTVRDANMNVVQFYYGEDGIMATKLENQILPLDAKDSKLSREDIKQQFGLKDVDWSTVLKEGGREDDNADGLLDAFVEDVLEDQKILIEQMFQGSIFGGSVNAPVNLARMILNVKTRFGLDPKVPTDLTPIEVLRRIPVLIERTQSSHVRLWCALLRCYLSPHKLIVKERFTRNAFDALCELIVVAHMKAWVQPGEQVGIIAAQSIGEPSTQLTLNTFHLAGVASKSNVNQGIPRLKEILKVSKNPTATSLLIYMKPEYRHSKEKARELVQDLELTLLRSITNKVAIYWEPNDTETVIPEDVELLAFYSEMELEKDSGITMSKWLLRLELNREEMFNKNISMADVVFVIQMMYDGIKTVYSDYNADKLVMRIHIPEGSEQDDFNHLKKFQSKLLNTCVIRGVPGIKAVTFREDKQKVELTGPEGRYTELVQYVLDTDGTNYVKVMNHPLVDANKLYTTNIYDIINILGLEAVRAILVQELIPIFGQDGVNYRHLGILCDYITRSGRLMSIDRYGINKNDVGPLGKMSFEETSKIVMNAALFGEVDPVTGVSANIMMGQPIRGGTAFSQILLDDQMLETLTKGLDAIPDDEEEEEGDLSGFMSEGAGSDPCHRSQFQVNMLMPSAIEGLEDEPPIDLYVKGSSEAITA
jgi:DNA-directed RNA polymerase beta' subunit/intein/homing endonuclease